MTNFDLPNYNVLTPELCFYLRELLGLTHEQLAKSAGISGKNSQSGRIRKYERGEGHEFSPRMKRVLHEAFARHGVSFINTQAGKIVCIGDEEVAHEGKPVLWLDALSTLRPTEWRHMRKELGLSQKQAERLSGVWQLSISRIENFRSDKLFTLRHKARLLRAYQISGEARTQAIPASAIVPLHGVK